MRIGVQPRDARGWRSLKSSRKPAPPPAGMLRGKGGRGGGGGSRPRNGAAMIVEPLRDEPGISARHWPRPIVTPSRTFISSKSRSRRSFAQRSASSSRMATKMTIVAMTQRLRNVDSMCFFSSRPRMTIGIVPMTTSHASRESTSVSGWRRPREEVGMRPDAAAPRLARVDVGQRMAFDRAAEEAGHEPHDVAEKVDDRGDPRAELDDRGEGGTGIAPAEEHGDDLEMCGRRNRNELGEALHEAEDDRFDNIQDRKSTRLNSSHGYISYAVSCF